MVEEMKMPMAEHACFNTASIFNHCSRSKSRKPHWGKWLVGDIVVMYESDKVACVWLLQL